MSLMCIDLYETDGLLLFRSKSIIFQTIDLERVIEKAENIFNFYLDFNWEFEFIHIVILSASEESICQSAYCRSFNSFRITRQFRFIGVNIRQSAEKKKGPGPFSIALFHNLIFVDTGDKCKSGFFEVNQAGGVYEAHGEDFSFESFCLPVHPAGGLAES